MKRSRPAIFRGRHFEPEIIATCVRWYLRFSLSLRNVEEMMAERGLMVDHTTVWRWCQKFTLCATFHIGYRLSPWLKHLLSRHSRL
jgi:hypothetical protein